MVEEEPSVVTASSTLPQLGCPDVAVKVLRPLLHQTNRWVLLGEARSPAYAMRAVGRLARREYAVPEPWRAWRFQALARAVWARCDDVGAVSVAGEHRRRGRPRRRTPRSAAPRWRPGRTGE